MSGATDLAGGDWVRDVSHFYSAFSGRTSTPSGEVGSFRGRETTPKVR